MPWLNPTIILAFIISLGVSGGVGFIYGNSHGKAKVTQQWDKEKKQIAEAVAAELERVRAKETKIQANADKQRKAKNEELRVVTARSAAIIDGLRKRPERGDRTEVPQSTGTCSAATGAELARGDGIFLARYATDAARLQNEFDHCVKQYNEVKRELNGESNENSGQRDKQE